MQLPTSEYSFSKVTQCCAYLVKEPIAGTSGGNFTDSTVSVQGSPVSEQQQQDTQREANDVQDAEHERIERIPVHTATEAATLRQSQYLYFVEATTTTTTTTTRTPISSSRPPANNVPCPFARVAL